MQRPPVIAARYCVAFLALALLACGPSADRDAGAADACGPMGCVDDPCAALVCPDPRHMCVVTGGGAVCACPGGTHAEGDRCVDDVVCTDTTCAGGGLCSEVDSMLTCECAEGYVGAFCEECADGYLRDPEGLCDSNLCDPNPCADLDRTRCAVEGGVAVCHCNAGTHEEAGRCVPDAACAADTCSMRGTCTDTADGPTCACETGYAGRFCESCDAASGYHGDGAGGCTTDLCLPDPCTAPPFTRCVVDAGGTTCECPVGEHREGASCVTDEVCTATSCGGHGACTVVDGRVSCACDVGYLGASCESCDAAVGYHDDGMGGCTDDVCVPNPCTDADRGVCAPSGSAYACACDPGYHEDGVGGCTTDPCLPHPCGTQACRVGAGGAAECYTRDCDDTNPCTLDTPTATGCDYTTLGDGTACSTTVCTDGQTCTAGTCGGGTTIDCGDTNPCTIDSCDATVGCTHAVDTVVIPDDGVACTVDSCATGAPEYVPSDPLCDDGLYCSGVERCTPSAGGADARGCVTTSAPLAPGPSSPCAYYACDEASDSFPLITLGAGASCDDGIACTTGDTCATAGGLCAGSVTASCTGGMACTSTTPWGMNIDIPTSSVTGVITVDGSPAPMFVPSVGYGSAYLWLVAKDTGVRHRIGRLEYTSSTSGGYNRYAGDDLIDVRLIPGVYDVLLQRGTSTSSSGSNDRWVGSVPTSVPVPAGWRVLRTDVVIPAGPSTLNVDIPTASVTGVITVDGAPAPMFVPAVGYGSAYLWAVATDTGVRHRIGRLEYTSSTSGGYNRYAGDDLIDVRLVPGTYDILLDRGMSASGSGSEDRWVGSVPGAVPVPDAWRVLRTGVVIPAGASTLTVDIPTASVTGVITVDGAPAPMFVPSVGYGSAYLWAVATDTGVRHRIGRLEYTSSTSGGYNRYAGDELIDVRLVPGTYDILLDRGMSTSGSGSDDRWVGSVPSAVPVPDAWRVLRTGVVIPAGASTLMVDIPTASVTGVITVDGATPPMFVPSVGYGSAYVWAVATDTGVRHRIGRLEYTSSTSGGYNRYAGDELIDVRLVPGTYDILLDRGMSTPGSGRNDRWVGSVPSSVPVPAGWRVLHTGVVIPAGASTLAVDIPTSSVSGVITVDGSPAPMFVPSVGYGSAYLWAVATDTGVRHRIGRLEYTSSTSGGYNRYAGDELIDVRLVPGTYDILLDRGMSTSGSGSEDRWVGSVPSAVPVPAAWRIIRSGVVVTAGSAVVDVDIPTSALAGEITVDGGTAPMFVPSVGYGSAYLWAIARDTGVRHRVGRLEYTSSTSGGYNRYVGDELVDVRLVPGTYDLLVDRGVSASGSGSDDRWVSSVPTTVPVPEAWRIVRQCVVVGP